MSAPALVSVSAKDEVLGFIAGASEQKPQTLKHHLRQKEQGPQRRERVFQNRLPRPPRTVSTTSERDNRALSKLVSFPTLFSVACLLPSSVLLARHCLLSFCPLQGATHPLTKLPPLPSPSLPSPPRSCRLSAVFVRPLVSFPIALNLQNGTTLAPSCTSRTC